MDFDWIYQEPLDWQAVTTKHIETEMHLFTADIDIIGLNPFVFVPNGILDKPFEQAGKQRAYSFSNTARPL